MVPVPSTLISQVSATIFPAKFTVPESFAAKTGSDNAAITLPANKEEINVLFITTSLYMLTTESIPGKNTFRQNVFLNEVSLPPPETINKNIP